MPFRPSTSLAAVASPRPRLAALLSLWLSLMPLASAAAIPRSQPIDESRQSKLSAHLINAYTTGASDIVSGHPRVLKILDLGSGMLQAARGYKTGTPHGKVVLRIYTTKNYPLSASPSASASNFWTTVLQPPLNGLSASDRALIDYLEGPNEGETTPTWQSTQSAQWFSTFWQTLAPLIATNGFKPCVGSIAVGNPPGNAAQVQNLISIMMPALRLAKSLGGAWSYHAYTINDTTDPAVEIFYSLRYRQFYALFTGPNADLADMPLILTEGGVDQTGSPATSGWQARGTAADYERWLNWFNSQLAQDSYVMGCTLFEIGNPGGWPSFDLEPIGGWMRDFLTPPTQAPPAPTGLTVLATNATVVLSWTNAPLNPTTYRVKRSDVAGGPYTLVATNVLNGVKASTYTDTTVASGGTYHYLVSAVNGFGEGPAAGEVTVTMPGVKLPDLIVTAVSWVPSPPFTGKNLTFRATVKNQGSAATPAGTTLGVGFSVDGSANIVWSASHTASLAAGASITLSADGGLSGNTWKATSGIHTVVATVDDVNRIVESNEGNNALSARLVISSAAPGLGQFLISPDGVVNFAFTATPGVPYQIQYKNTLSDPLWLDLGVAITATSTNVPVSDTTTNLAQRFYRVMQTN